jgi:hypothetical protein
LTVKLVKSEAKIAADVTAAEEKKVAISVKSEAKIAADIVAAEDKKAAAKFQGRQMTKSMEARTFPKQTEM